MVEVGDKTHQRKMRIPWEGGRLKCLREHGVGLSISCISCISCILLVLIKFILFEYNHVVIVIESQYRESDFYDLS